MGIVDSKTIAHFEFAKRSTRVFADESALYLNKQWNLRKKADSQNLKEIGDNRMEEEIYD